MEASSMPSQKIYVLISTQQNHNVYMTLTPFNYQQEFKDWIKINKVSKHDAILLKKQLEKQLVAQMNRIRKLKSESPQRRDYHRKEQIPFQQADFSPSFRPINSEKQSQNLHQNLNDSFNKKAHQTHQKNSPFENGNIDESEISSILASDLVQQREDSFEIGNIDEQKKQSKQQKPITDTQKKRNSYTQSAKVMLEQNQTQKKQQNNLLEQKPQINKPRKCLLLENFNIQESHSFVEKCQNKTVKNVSPHSKRQRSINKTDSKQSEQRQLLHQVYFRLNSQKTASSVSKEKKNRSVDMRQEREYNRFLLQRSLNPPKYKYNSEIFDRLYQIQTASSFYRKQNALVQENLSEDQNVFNGGVSSAFTDVSVTKQKPNMKSKVYQSPAQKKCTVHCGAKLKQIETEADCQKEELRKDQTRERVMASIKEGRPIKTGKISGQCQSCHRKRIEQKSISLRKKEKQKKQKAKQQHSPSKSKEKSSHSLGRSKNIIPNYVSEVLEQSYVELFEGYQRLNMI